MAKMTPKKIFSNGLWDENPVFRQILGICSALAVTNLMVNTFIMGLSLIFVTSLSSVTVSVLRNVTPVRTRMMVQTLIIASYVIIVDIVLKAYLPDISEALGPYVGLIITNCIIMGRCEGFARNNKPWPSFLDGVASGAGYALVLLGVWNGFRTKSDARKLRQLDDYDYSCRGLLHVGCGNLGSTLHWIKRSRGQSKKLKEKWRNGRRSKRLHHIFRSSLHE